MQHPSVSTYAALRKKVEETLLLGQRQIEEAKVRTYWETGKLISEHILHHKDRAEYGRRTLERLSRDLEVGTRLLERTLQFFRRFPEIPSGRTELTWSHYRALLTIPDGKKRLEFLRKAVREEWISDDLEAAIHKAEPFQPNSLKPVKTTDLLTPHRGVLYTYRILDPKTVQPKEPGLLLIDLGFSSYRDLDAVSGKTFKPLDIIESVKTGDDTYTLKRFSSPHVPLDPQDTLYTYKATVEKVVDGDTLRVVVDLGFNTRTRQYLRLRGLNCSELGTPEGEAASAFVKSRINQADEILLSSSRSDKYDRYLADVFFIDSTGQEVYLNNLLLKRGNAVRMMES